MTTVVPSSFKAGRDLIIDGVPVSFGAVLTDQQVRWFPKLDVMLSTRRVVPVPDPHLRRTSDWIPTPTSISPVAYQQLFL